MQRAVLNLRCSRDSGLPLQASPFLIPTRSTRKPRRHAAFQPARRHPRSFPPILYVCPTPPSPRRRACFVFVNSVPPRGSQFRRSIMDNNYALPCTRLSNFRPRHWERSVRRTFGDIYFTSPAGITIFVQRLMGQRRWRFHSWHIPRVPPPLEFFSIHACSLGFP